MSNKWIYDKVDRIVKKYKTRDPLELITSLGIKLHFIDSPSRLLGAYQIILRNRVIFLANNIGSLRDTVLAHELGHDQLHRSHCLKGAAFHENKVFNPTNKYEIEANIFAAHLLIPDEDLIQAMKSNRSDKQMAAEMGVDINLLNLKISELAKLKKLPVELNNIERPKSDFLVEYNPRDDS